MARLAVRGNFARTTMQEPNVDLLATSPNRCRHRVIFSRANIGGASHRYPRLCAVAAISSTPFAFYSIVLTAIIVLLVCVTLTITLTRRRKRGQIAANEPAEPAKALRGAGRPIGRPFFLFLRAAGIPAMRSGRRVGPPTLLNHKRYSRRKDLMTMLGPCPGLANSTHP